MVQVIERTTIRPDVTVAVLGPLEVVVHGERVELSSRRQRALLAALALRERPVPVGDLVDAVWDDEPPEGARTTLQTYVSRLRRLLGRDVVHHGPAGYRLGPSVGTDVAEVQAGVRSLEQLDPDDAESRAALALDLLDRWTGAALAEFADVDWFVGARVELDQLRAELRDVAGESLIRSGRAKQAIGLLESAVAAQPWREPTRLLLLRALAAAGRTTDAVRAAARYRRDLGETTGLVPGRAFDALEAELLSGDIAGPEPTGPPTVPPTGRSGGGAGITLPRPTALVGRRSDLDELIAAARNPGVVTVVGPGGIGKTRLVAELAAHAERRFVVVELAPATPGEVAATVAARLGIRAEAATPAMIAERLTGDTSTVVLDNAEHVLAEVRDLCGVVAAGAPAMTLVVTSRARLDIAAETVLTLAPLPVDGIGSDAATLFRDRLRRAGPRYDLAGDDPTIERLCRRLDGVPLALELAASRAAVLGLADLDRLLDDSLDVLGVVDDGLGRHATLGNVVAWSVGLLGAPARRLLAALSVFRGEFDLEAAAAVGAAVVDEPVAGLLGRLVDTSLVSAGATPGTFHLLAMVRDFATDQLAGLERVAEVRHAHATWLAGRLRAIDARLPGGEETGIARELDALRHEVHAAIRWAVDGGRLDAAVAIAAALAGPTLYRPNLDLVREIRRISDVPALVGAAHEGAALAAGARAAFLLGDLDAVDGLVDRALAVAGDDPRVRHRACHARGVVRLYQGDFAPALACFEAVTASTDASPAELLDALGGVALARCYAGDLAGAADAVDQLRGMLVATPSATYHCFAAYVRAEIHLAQHEIDAAAALLAAAAEEAWEVDALFVWGVASTVLAAVLVRHRPADEARAHLPGLVDRWRRTATWPQLWTTLRLVAEHLAATGRPDVARLVATAADLDASAPTPTGDDADRLARLRDALSHELGEAAARAIDAAAASVDRVTVLDRAREALDGPIAP